MNDKEAKAFANKIVKDNERRNGPYKEAFAHNEKLESAYYMKSSDYANNISAETAKLANLMNVTVKHLSEVKELQKEYSKMSDEQTKLIKISEDLGNKEINSVEKRTELYK